MPATWSLPACWKAGEPPLGTRVVSPPFPLIGIPAPEVAGMGTNNVVPQEIETVLHTQSAVAAAEVVGIPELRLDLVPAAFLQLPAHRTAAVEQVAKYCAGPLALLCHQGAGDQVE
jgi:acyl-CoA synthetase (AMP-forming)/AMP-acid ligase II